MSISANVAIAAFGLWWLTQLAVPWHKEDRVSKTVRDYVLDIVKEATDRGLVLEEEDVHYSDGLFYIDGMEASEWLNLM